MSTRNGKIKQLIRVALVSGSLVLGAELTTGMDVTTPASKALPMESQVFQVEGRTGFLILPKQQPPGPTS